MAIKTQPTLLLKQSIDHEDDMALPAASQNCPSQIAVKFILPLIIQMHTIMKETSLAILKLLIT